MCNEPIGDISQLDPELKDQVYRPGVEERYNVEIDFKDPANREPQFEVEETL